MRAPARFGTAWPDGKSGTMERRRIGRLEVSLAGLGTNNFGRRLDATATREVVAAALDAGVTHFDTADIYGEGRSEEYLGRALGGASRRSDRGVQVRPRRTASRRRPAGRLGAAGRRGEPAPPGGRPARPPLLPQARSGDLAAGDARGHERAARAGRGARDRLLQLLGRAAGRGRRRGGRAGAARLRGRRERVQSLRTRAGRRRPRHRRHGSAWRSSPSSRSPPGC